MLRARSLLAPVHSITRSGIATGIDASIPLDDWLQSLFGAPPADLVPLSLLRQRYLLLAAANATSFAHVIAVNAVRNASVHAANFYSTHPRISINKILSDSQDAQSMGLLPFLTARSEALRPVTIQQTTALEPDLDASMMAMPPRPPDNTLPQYHQLHNGTDLIIPPGFVPDGCLMLPPKPPPYALTVEFKTSRLFFPSPSHTMSPSVYSSSPQRHSH